MTREEMIAEIRRRSAFPFDFTAASDADLAQVLADMDGDDDRFTVSDDVSSVRQGEAAR